MRIVSISAEQTKKIAGNLAKDLSKSKPVGALILALKGDLGAGKTTFVQGFIKALLPKARVKSPTFLLMKHYPRRGRDIYHIDCYRVKEPRGLKNLEIKEILTNPKNIVLIEWPERMQKILPKKKISISMRHGKENERTIIISGL